jgi:hypothetical protein
MGGGVFEGQLVQAICHAPPPPAADSVHHLLHHQPAGDAIFPMKTLSRNHPTRGATALFARASTKPQDDASRSAAWSFDGDAIFSVRLPATSYGHGVRRIVSRNLSQPQKRTLTGSQGANGG